MIPNGDCRSSLRFYHFERSDVVTRIKICGLTRKEDVDTALKLNVHAIGFVFYPNSPRYVSPERARELMEIIPPFVTTVGLFVNATVDEVANVLAIAPVKLLQFHGDETPQQCNTIADRVQRQYLRALRVKPDMSGDDLVQYERLYRQGNPSFAGLLLDTYVDSFGGSGKVFDWSIIPKELAHRVVLSGGLTAQNVSGAVTKVRPGAVDVSSGVELAKGIKDPAKMQAFVQAMQLADTYLPE